jgi:alkyl sulfatase BDS1-like metallo-beta-lactamase superfamily hydrolase
MSDAGVKEDKSTPLSSLVTAGVGQTEAEAITDTIFMVKDISNAYLITTGDGDLLVNTGFMGNDQRNKGLFAPHRTGPLRRIILTQAHADHFGAVPGLKEDSTQIIAGKGFLETDAFFTRLQAFLGRRSGKLWGGMMRRDGPPPVPPKVIPNLEVEDRHAFEQGGRKFEVIKLPGGETLCTVNLWMPDERIVFTGNVFGPVWRAMPNLTTTRGDKPRLVGPYLRSIEMIRDLAPELVITGHGEPIRGAERIRADLQTMHDAVSHIERETIAGMNAGKSVYELMQEIRLPAELQIGEFHGNTRWTVRAVWDENANWFKYEDGTTALFGSPRSSVDGDLVDLIGAGGLAERAQSKLAEGKPLEALHLAEIAVNGAPDDRDALSAKRAALQALAAASAGQNLSETMWLKSEIGAVDAKLI